MGGRVTFVGNADGAEPGVEYDPPAPPRKREPVVVKADTYIERPDLGRGAVTLVRKGDTIPAPLMDFPRRQATARVRRGHTR